MQDTFKLGSVRGIPIGMHWSLLFVFGLVVLALAVGVYPEVHEGYPPGAYLGAALATGVAFFGSVVAHELGHGLLAQRKGVEVEGITLWLFGGMARFTNPPTNPDDDLKIAAIGPAISVLAGAVFGLAWWVLAAVGASPLAVLSLGWLALINVALAIFNLVPAAPLDGGRVLRALLWKRTGDPREATRRAAHGGRIFGIALIVLGAVEVAFGRFGGIWLMLIGWFLVVAARGEETSSWLQGVRVREVMSTDPVVAPDWMTVDAFLEQYVWGHRFSTFPLRSFGGQLSGLLTLAAIKRVPAARRPEVRVREVACPIDQVPVVSPDDELTSVMGRMSGGCAGGRALVLDGDDLVGIVSPTDISRVVELGPLRREDQREVAPTHQPATGSEQQRPESAEAAHQPATGSEHQPEAPERGPDSGDASNHPTGAP